MVEESSFQALGGEPWGRSSAVTSVCVPFDFSAHACVHMPLQCVSVSVFVQRSAPSFLVLQREILSLPSTLFKLEFSTPE